MSALIGDVSVDVLWPLPWAHRSIQLGLESLEPKACASARLINT